MKKLANILIAIGFIVSLRAQQVEWYPTSQRYLFNEYNKDSLPVDSLFPIPPFASITAVFSSSPSQSIDISTDTVFEIVAQRYGASRGDSAKLVYGVALPICYVTVTDSHMYGIDNLFMAGFGEYPAVELHDSLFSQRWQQVLDFYSGPERYAYLMVRDSVQLDDVVFWNEFEINHFAHFRDRFRPMVLDSTLIRLGVNTVTGNRFHFPNVGNWPTGQNSYYTFEFPTIEIYFDEPVWVIDTFWVGASILSTLGHGDWYGFGLFAFIDPSEPGCVYEGFNMGNYQVPNYFRADNFSGPTLQLQPACYVNYLDTTPGSVGYEPNPTTCLWGGPFAIVAPPPCLKPHDLRVETLHYDSVVVRWDVPVRVSYSRLEYGPEGFVLGTGTVVDSIFGGECRIGGLSENTVYDVYVTGWCTDHGCWSDWSDTSFTTPEACPTKIQMGETRVTDSSVYVEWYLPGEASYGEALFRRMGEDGGTLYGPLQPDAAGRCSLYVDGLESGTVYEIRMRNWCPYSSTYSAWEVASAKTLAHYTLTVQSNNAQWGTATGSGSYLDGTYVTMQATPANGYCHFASWSDGVLYATRIHQMTGDTTFTAIFFCDTATTGIPEANRLAFGIAPNPTGGQLTVTLNESSPCEAEVYDATGRCVLRATLQGPQSDLDVRRLPAGRYLLRLTSGDKSGIKVFVRK